MEIGSSNKRRRSASTIFCTYVVRNTEFALARVQQAAHSLSVEDQKLVFKTLNYALKYDETWPVTRNLLMSVAQKMEQAGYRGEWMAYLEIALQHCQKQKDLFAEANFHFYMGIIYQHQSKFEFARRQLQCSALQFKQIGDELYEARALNRLAYVARLQRRLEEAKRTVERAQLLAKDDPAELAYSYLVRGSIALDQKDWQNAENFFDHSLTLWKKTEDKRGVAWGWTNLGTAFRVLKKHNDAISCYLEAIALFEEVSDPVHQAVARMNLGNAYLDLDQPKKALKFYNLSEPIFYDAQEWLRLAKVNLNKAIAYQYLKNWPQAECACLSSIEQWRQIGSISSMVKASISLAEIYIDQGLHKKASEVLHDADNELQQIEDEIGYDELSNIITKMLNTL